MTLKQKTDQLFELHYRSFYELPENAWKDIFAISESPFNSWKSYFKEDFKFFGLNLDQLNRVYEIPCFYAAYCSIEDISFLNQFKNLVELDLSHNLINLNSNNQINSISEVFLIGCEIRNEQLEFIKNCDHLFLSYNFISKLDNIVSNNPNLTILDLSNNSLEELANVPSHKSLMDLNLEHNYIKTIDGIANLEALRKLYINNNSLMNADALIEIQNLEEITIHYNNFDGEYFEKLESSLLAKGVNVAT